MGAAAAKIVFHMADDLVTRRSRIVAEQHIGVQQHARSAIAALKRAVVNEGLLQRMQLTFFGKPLDGQHLGAGDLIQRREAGSARLAIDHHGAGTANALAASVFGAGQSQIGAKDPQQHPIVVGIEADRAAVKVKLNDVSHLAFHDQRVAKPRF